VHDEIHLDPFSTGVGNRNMPPLRRTGLEVEVRRSVSDFLELFGAYTHTRARFQEGVLAGSPFTQSNVVLAGRTVPLVARHKLDLAADLRITAATRVRAEVRSLSEQYMENDEGNSFGRRIPAYAVTDLTMQHRVGAWKATFAIANL